MKPDRKKNLQKKRVIIVCSILIILFSSIVLFNNLILLIRCYKHLKDSLKEIPPIYKNIPPEKSTVIYFCVGKTQMPEFLSYWTLKELHPSRMSIFKWHLRGALCSKLIGLFFQEHEIFLLWCYSVRYEKGKGLENAAVYYINKSLSELNSKELIKVLCILKSPGYYKKHPDRLKRMVEKIYKEYCHLKSNQGKTVYLSVQRQSE